MSFCFFFSSRRRHTIFDCDWSSDVCSSDLGAPALAVRDQRLARQCALAVLSRSLRPGEEGLHVRQRLIARAQTAQYLGKIVFRARFHARVGGGLLELTPRELAIKPRQIRE